MSLDRGLPPKRGGPVTVAMSSKPPSGRTAADELEIPSMLHCGLVILWVKLLLRSRGFIGTLQWVRRRVERVPAKAALALEVVEKCEYAVAMAGALYPGRAKCLEQSLALYCLLRRRGIAVKYCQGVQPFPFQAHAWVEYRGQVINDIAEHAEQFARLPDQLP